MYTIGVKRRFFGYRKYKVTSHRTEVDIKVKTFDERDVITDIEPRLFLTMADDSIVLIPGITKKQWKIFPDFKEENDKKRLQWQDTQAKNSTVPPQT